MTNNSQTPWGEQTIHNTGSNSKGPPCETWDSREKGKENCRMDMDEIRQKPKVTGSEREGEEYPTRYGRKKRTITPLPPSLRE